MQSNKYYKFMTVLLTLMVMASINGCIKEDRSGLKTEIVLEVDAVISVDGVDMEIDEGTIEELMFYVFGENEEFLAVHHAEIGSTISLYYPTHDKLTLVCWGNSDGGEQVLPILEVGDKLDDALISVVIDGTKTSQEKVTIHPNNLFHTIQVITMGTEVSSVIKLVIHPKTTPVKIITTGLGDYLGVSDKDLDIKYILRSGKEGINFRGVTTGEDVNHTQKAKFINGRFESTIFNILPSVDKTKAIEVDIYNSDALVATITTTSAGNPIKAVAGDTLNIRATFKALSLGEIGVTVAAQSVTGADLDYLVDELNLYVFDDDWKFLGVQSGKIDSKIILYYPNQSTLNTICWANSDGHDKQEMPEFVVGTRYDLDKLMISVCTHGNEGIYVDKHPDNLFHTIKKLTVNPDVVNAPVEMIITPKVARVDITATGDIGENIHYVFRGKRQMSFSTGSINPVPENRMIYTKLATFNGSDAHDAFNIIPSASPIEIDVYRGAEIYQTITTDIYGNTFTAKQGEVLAIDLVFKKEDGVIDVTVKNSGWDGEFIDKEF